MTIFYPMQPTRWNGKLFIVLPGAASYPPLGSLVPRSQSDLFTPGLGRNDYLELMIDKGYAVARFRIDLARAQGVSKIILADGTVFPRSTFREHVALPLAMVEFAQNYVEEVPGKRPDQTYWYGFSGGARVGRLINYAPAANKTREGKTILNGLLIDDSGAGRPVARLLVDGEDVLLRDFQSKEDFVPQIDVAHQIGPEDNLQRQRRNAELLLEKGLQEKFRYYELIGVAHLDAGRAGTVGTLNNLDLGGLVDAMIDLLEGWVDRAIEPPPSRADIPGFAPAVSLPEIACPLGVYYGGPASARNVSEAEGTTAFAAFDGINLEPVNFFNALVDMNENGIHDTRETVTQAWQRLGLLAAAKDFVKGRYVSCLSHASNELVRERLLPNRVRGWYRKEADEFLSESGVSF